MAISNIEMHKRITRHLENSHIIISPENEWFKQCVDFFISDNPNCDVKDLSAMVVEQLSLSDFQEIGLFSLPANLNNCDKKVLTGKYCLQVNTILNVGQSCYSQYNILVKRDTSNTEIGDDKPAPWEPKTHRMLKMMCSDGQQDIVAMEYESLQCLKEPFIPGFKIVVVGPVEYRKGVLLLKSTNVHFIGGEVEHLLIKNAPLNVLCRALNKPELENPYIFSNIEVENAVMEVHEPSDIIPPRRIENVSTVGIREQNSVIPPTSTNQSNNTNSNHTGSGIITYDDFFDGDDDLLYLTQMAEIETKFTESNNVSLQTFGTDQNNTKVNKTTIAVPKNNNITNKKPAVTAKQTKISDMLGPSTSTAFRGSVAESTRCQNDRSIENNSKNVKQISAKRIASSPVYTETKRPSIELPKPDDDWGDIDMDIDVSNPLIKVLNSASIIKNSKIQVKQNEWICSGIVMDESKHEEAEFSSEVLERLIGISSEEVLQLKNNPSNCAPLKEKIEKGIKGAYRKLHLFKGYRKQTSTMNYSNPACCIKSCDQTACYVFDSMSYDELNTFWIVSKINFRLLNNEEQPSQNICFCKPHYDQVLLISQCELCGNRSMDMVTLQDNVRECQLILNEDNIPITIKCGILICKPCKLYTLLRNDKTIKITCELQKHIDAVITRIKNKNISTTNGLEGIQLAKNEINIKKKEESNQLIMVKFLTQYISNFFTADSSIPSQLVSSVLNLDAIRTPPLLVSAEVLKVMETFTVPITVSIETGLRIEKLMAVLTKDKWDAKFTMENSTALTLNRKKKRTFLDENSSVPRTKKPKIRSVKPTTHVDKATIADYKSLYNNSPVLELALRPYHPVVDNKYEETLKTYSRIKKPTDMSTIQLHQNTFNSQSMPPPNEFPELSRKRAGPTTLSPTTSGKKQLFEYPNISIDKPTVADYKSLYNNSPVLELALRPYHPVVDNKYEKTLKTYSRIKKPTDVSTIQLHQNTFNSQSMPPPNEFPELSRKRAGPTTLSPTTSGMKQLSKNPNISVDKPTIADHKPLYNKSLVSTNRTRSTSSRTEFPELSRQRTCPTTLSSTMPDMIQLFENLKIPYSNEMDFLTHLINLETCRSLGTLTVGNNKTTHHRRTSNTVTTSPQIIHCSPEHKESQTISHADDDGTDLSN